MAMYYNGKKVRNLYFNGKCITRLALGKEMTRLVEGDDFERAEWLVGDGSAYIEGVSYDLWDNNLALQIGKANFSGSPRRYIVANYLKIGEDRNTSPSYFMVIFRQDNNSAPHIADIHPYSSMPDVVTMDFYIENSLFYCNQNGVIKTNNPAQTAIESTWKSVTPLIYSMKMSYIREVLPDGSYRSNLTPCRLLRPIPAALDANGIARNAGECGMFDSISGKFYGNVASSGAFTVEPSLVEGVDYERHRWLKGEIPIGASMLSLPVNSSSFEFKCKFFTPSNCGYFSTEGYAYYKDSGAEAMKIWSSSGTYGWASQTTVSDGDLIEIISSTSGTTINGESVPQNNFPITNIRINQAANATRQAIKHISSITVDNIERYIPVRLLRPLPSYLDANGKARSQFECGMLDLKTMKFYGNVAATGKFTVSDN